MPGFLILLAWVIGILGSLGPLLMILGTMGLGLPLAIVSLLGSLAVAGILGGLGSILTELKTQNQINHAILKAQTKGSETLSEPSPELAAARAHLAELQKKQVNRWEKARAEAEIARLEAEERTI